MSSRPCSPPDLGVATASQLSSLPMGLVRNLAIAALFAGAYASNPDEGSFRRYVERELQK